MTNEDIDNTLEALNYTENLPDAAPNSDIEVLCCIRTQRQKERETARKRRKSEVKANNKKKAIMSFSPWLGPYYEKNGHIKNINLRRKYYKKTGNKRIRAYDEEPVRGSQYKKIYDLWWEVW